MDEDNKYYFDLDKRSILDDFNESFILPHPKEKHIEETPLGNCISAMVMVRKVDFLRPMSVSIINMNTCVNRTRRNK